MMRAFIGRLAHTEPGFDVNHAALAPMPHTVQSLSHAVVSHAVGLSRAAFMARFSTPFGESPMSLLRRVRMRHAADLLTANALSIDQVALCHVVECKGSSA
jgi:transcriptional regulator GlxA family with amidase domain